MGDNLREIQVVHGYNFDMDVRESAKLRLSFAFIERLLFKGIITTAGAAYLRKGELE